MISATAMTHQGLVRSSNEDTVVLPGLLTVGTLQEPLRLTYRNSEARLFAVVDGMGGQRGGQDASRHVAQYLLDNSHLEIWTVLAEANSSVYARTARDPSLSRMGATIAGTLLQKNLATVFNVGDSRVYHFADGYLALVTTDDRTSPDSSIVTQSLGGADQVTEISPHIRELGLEPGHRLLICSDGLSEVVPFQIIQRALDENTSGQVVTVLLDAALTAGAPDNVSLILLEMEVDD